MGAQKPPAEPAPDGPVLVASSAQPESQVARATSLLEELDFRALWLENTLNDWLILLGAILVGLAAGKVAAAVLGRLGRRVEARGWRVQAHLLKDLASPASLALLTLGLTVGVAQLKMSHPMHAFSHKTLLLLYSLAAFWYAYNLIAIIDVVLPRITRKTESTLDVQLLPLVRKTLRIFLVVIAVLFIVDTVFNQDIGAWLAGLGIAGLAVSLAAQDSLKNVFGSITILLDQPFRIGDQIAVTGYDGVVEQIGFRSTKVRTPSGSLVNIPNANIVNNPVENKGRKPYIFRAMNLALAVNTPRDKVEQAVQIVRGILAQEGTREPIHQASDGEERPPRVYFSDVTPESLTLSVTYWYVPPDYWAYMEHAEKVNLRVLGALAEAGIALAQPALAPPPKR